MIRPNYNSDLKVQHTNKGNDLTTMKRSLLDTSNILGAQASTHNRYSLKMDLGR